MYLFFRILASSFFFPFFLFSSLILFLFLLLQSTHTHTKTILNVRFFLFYVNKINLITYWFCCWFILDVVWWFLSVLPLFILLSLSLSFYLNKGWLLISTILKQIIMLIRTTRKRHLRGRTSPSFVCVRVVQ